jgi:hypothetical protein
MFSGDYFRPIAEEVFAETLQCLGAKQTQPRIVKSLEHFARDLTAEPTGTYVLGTFGLRQTFASNPDAFSRSLCFEADDWFVEIFEYPGDAHAHAYDGRPCHYVHIDIWQVDDSPDQSVDIGCAIPDGLPLKEDKILWRYSDLEEMREVLLRARDKIFIPFVVPILSDSRKLKEFLYQVRTERRERWADRIADHNSSIYHSRAEGAFKAKDFHRYLDEIERVSSGRLTKVDLARIRFVSKRVRSRKLVALWRRLRAAIDIRK